MSSSTEINYPSDIEWTSSDYRGSAEYLNKTFGWDIQDMPQHKMAFGDMGLKLTVMIRNEMPYDHGTDQRCCFYMTVPDVRMEMSRLEKLGATVFKEPETVPNMGIWGLLKLPGNMILGLWAYLPGAQQMTRSITKQMSDVGALFFFEIVNSEPKKVVDFYNKAYGWGLEESQFRGGYWYGSNKQTFSLGVRQAKQGEKNSLTGFVNVTDLSLSTSNLTTTGSKVTGPPEDYKPHGMCQKVTTPGGIVIALWQASPAAPHPTTQPAKSSSKPMAETEKVPMTKESSELAGH